MAKLQDICLVADNDGPRFVRNCFDRWPASIRHRVRESPFNLCCGCVQIKAWEIAKRMLHPSPSILDYRCAIEGMERQIREKEKAPA